MCTQTEAARNSLSFQALMVVGEIFNAAMSADHYPGHDLEDAHTKSQSHQSPRSRGNYSSYTHKIFVENRN